MRAPQSLPKQCGSLVRWFGGNVSRGQAVGNALGDLGWCGVPFAGGCSELPYIRTKTGVAADKHLHILNLARVVQNRHQIETLIKRLSNILYHHDELAEAQRRCLAREEKSGPKLAKPDLDWAVDYFVCAWFIRGGTAGDKREFRGALGIIWDHTPSPTRAFVVARERLRLWHIALQRWQFVKHDGIEITKRAKDKDGCGLYVDPPWPVIGNRYLHTFTNSDHEELAKLLSRFKKTRVVLRFGDHPLIRTLYPSSRWIWVKQKHNNQCAINRLQFMILNKAAFGESRPSLWQ